MTENNIPLLPDEVIEGLRQRCEQAEGYQWDVGDYLVEVVDEFHDLYDRAGVARARAVIFTQLANRVGVDQSTLRDRESMCRVFTPPIREEFTPLTYSQLRACKSAGSAWREHAEWALANLPAPCALIRARIKHNGQLPPRWQGLWERMLDLAGEVVVQEDAPGSIRQACRWLLKIAEQEGQA